MRLKIIEGVKRAPELYDFPFLVVPNVRKFKKLREPVKPFPTVSDKLVDFLLGVTRDVHLTVVRVRGVVRRHTISTHVLFKSLFHHARSAVLFLLLRNVLTSEHDDERYDGQG